MHPRLIPCVLILAGAPVAGCDVSDDAPGSEVASDSDGATSDGAAFDEDAVIARALEHETALTNVNVEARPSQHGLAETVDVWVDDGSLAAYLSLDPDAPDSAAPWPAEALLVKTHLDADGATTGLTIMAQGDPTSMSGGWWWGRVDADGTVRETGQVGFCISCHTPREPQGWAFGVPADNRG